MSAGPPDVTGGCLCGSIRYRIEGSVPPGAHCHCTMCRRSSGAPVVTWTTVPLHAFRLTQGELAVYRSSHFAERRFCPTCGAQIAFWSSRQPDVIDVSVATFDHPEDHPPDHHVYIGDRLPWLRIDEGLVGYAGDTPAEHSPRRPQDR